jgi:hypothetical protein
MRFKEEVRRAGDQLVRATVFTGDRLIGVDWTCNSYEDYSFDAYRESALFGEFNPLDPSTGVPQLIIRLADIWARNACIWCCGMAKTGQKRDFT